MAKRRQTEVTHHRVEVRVQEVRVELRADPSTVVGAAATVPAGRLAWDRLVKADDRCPRCRLFHRVTRHHTRRLTDDPNGPREQYVSCGACGAQWVWILP